MFGAGIALLLLAVAWKLAGSGGASDARRAAPVIVQVERPRLDTVYVKLSYTADVLPIQQANIYAKINGNLERMYVDIGQHVTEGQLLALIDTLELSQLAQQAQATYENALRNYERAKDLADQQLIAKQELDNTFATLKVAKANYDAASTRLHYAHITAPFSGYITKRLVDAGVNLKSNDIALLTLMNTDKMKIYVSVLEKDIPLITRGKKGIVTVDAYPGKEFYGVVTKLSEAVDLSTRTMAAQIDVENADHLLKPGMFADVTVLVDSRPGAVTIPLQSVGKDETGKFIYAVTGSVAQRKGITTGVEQNSRVEILSGVSTSDSIVTTGAQFVKDGGSVTIQP
jgi:RND family efflux transporter MFP subunit